MELLLEKITLESFPQPHRQPYKIRILLHPICSADHGIEACFKGGHEGDGCHPVELVA